MSQIKKKVLIIVPAQTGRGGVYNFYENLKFHLPNYYKLFYLKGNAEKKPTNKLLITVIHFKNIIKKLKSKEYDKIILNPSLNLNAVIRDAIISLVAFCLKIEVIVFWRGWNFDNEKYFKFPYIIITSFLLKAKKVIVLYSEIETSLRSFGFIGNVFLMTTIVNDETFEYSSKQEKECENLIFLSRIEEYKGVFELLEAYKILKVRYPNITLTIAGQGGAFEEIKQKVNEEKIDGVKMPGYIVGKEKYELLASSDVFLFPSYSEGMPNAVLEAMAIGLPIITTRVGGLNDFFENGKMGYVLDVKSVDSIVEKLEINIKNTAKAEKMGSYNTHYAREHFRASNVANKFLSIIDEC
jgi:glycosyltransferase involved in cell wall biosynthesis